LWWTYRTAIEWPVPLLAFQQIIVGAFDLAAAGTENFDADALAANQAYADGGGAGAAAGGAASSAVGASSSRERRRR
jgi:hypothetical protein